MLNNWRLLGSNLTLACVFCETLTLTRSDFVEVADETPRSIGSRAASCLQPFAPGIRRERSPPSWHPPV